MGFLDALFGKRDTVPAPHSMVGFPNDGGLMFGGVTATTSLGLSAVWRCLDILSNGVSQLNWCEYRGNLELPPSRIVQRPQAQRTRREWSSLVVSTLALYDVCYLLKVGEDSEGVPLGLWYIDPSLISPVTYDYVTFLPPDEYYLGQEKVSADRFLILHRSPQPTIQDTLGGVLQLAKVTFAAALAAERYASRYWQGGGSPHVVLETDQKLDDPKAISLSDRWAQKRAMGPDYAPVMDAGLKARDFGADPTTASAVDARRELVSDIGRYFGIGSSLLNSPNQSSETYTTTEAEGIHLVRYTLQNYINAIEDGISDQLPGGRYMQMETSVLTQGTQLARAQSWQLASSGKAWMTPNEIREAEGLPPVEDETQFDPAPAPVAAGDPNGIQQPA